MTSKIQQLLDSWIITRKNNRSVWKLLIR